MKYHEKLEMRIKSLNTQVRNLKHDNQALVSKLIEVADERDRYKSQVYDRIGP